MSKPNEKANSAPAAQENQANHQQEPGNFSDNGTPQDQDRPNLFEVLNYQYQDSDLEQFL